MTPLECAADSPLAICCAQFTACDCEIGPPSSFPRSVSPSSSSVTAYTWPSWVPKSKIARMFGCESAATAFASRSKRASASASAVRCCGSTLTATSRSSFASRAR